MNVFSQKEFKMYKNILGMTQPTLLRAMEVFLKKYYKQVIATNDFVLAFGDIPIALCAHLDTVFSKPPTEIFYDRQENVIWSPQGAGHDDRAGVFMIMQIIQNGLRPNVIFTTDEEIGCNGASILTGYKNPFKDLKYIIQLDRRGVDDCVFYYGDNKDFIKYVESFGFREAKGSFTDIVVLCPEWEVCGVNLSVGYRNEHSVIETLFVSVYFNTMQKVINMLKNPPTQDFIYTEKLPASLLMPLPATGGKCKCERCGQTVYEPDVDLYPVKTLKGEKKNFCIECMMTNVSWCVLCNEAFETNEAGREICYDCERKTPSVG